MAKVSGILLAAGASRRFGSDKLSQHLPDGEWVAVRACRNLLAGVDQVTAVVRVGNTELAGRLQKAGATVLEFTSAELGMGDSLAFAIRNTPESGGWLVALADMPWIAPATVRRVAEALRGGALVAAPSWQGQRGHPVGFASALGAELRALSGDSGAKAIIAAYSAQMTIIESDDAGVLRDIDQPGDLLPAQTKPLCL